MTCARKDTEIGDIVRTDGCWGMGRGCLASQEDCVHKSENVCLLITDSIGISGCIMIMERAIMRNQF